MYKNYLLKCDELITGIIENIILIQKKKWLSLKKRNRVLRLKWKLLLNWIR